MNLLLANLFSQHGWKPTVSLPWECFQEIKHMMMKQSMYGLFFTCTQNLVYIYTIHNQSLTKPPCEKKKRIPTYLEDRCLAHGGESPSTLVPCLVATAPNFDSNPLHPFPTPSACITLHYKDDINNFSLLHPGHLLMLYFKKCSNLVQYVYKILFRKKPRWIRPMESRHRGSLLLSFMPTAACIAKFYSNNICDTFLKRPDKPFWLLYVGNYLIA